MRNTNILMNGFVLFCERVSPCGPGSLQTLKSSSQPPESWDYRREHHARFLKCLLTQNVLETVPVLRCKCTACSCLKALVCDLPIFNKFT